jgi:(p)ppGpp synthase/HD superfamily hydrolase
VRSQMPLTGYSDRINHALAFAAKHHDQQVRRGVRLPYLTHPPNVAIILTRYGQDDDTVVAWILLNVVRDYLNENRAPELVAQRVGDKFGSGVLATVVAAAPRRVDDEGVELAPDERRADMLRRVVTMADAARWVVAADALHEAASMLADLRRTIDRNAVWSRRNDGRQLAWYRELARALTEAGFSGAILDELMQVVDELEAQR